MCFQIYKTLCYLFSSPETKKQNSVSGKKVPKRKPRNKPKLEKINNVLSMSDLIDNSIPNSIPDPIPEKEDSDLREIKVDSEEWHIE